MNSSRAYIIILALFLIFLFLGVEAASRNNERESLDFILPNPNEELGAKCLQFSLYFCLMGLWTNTKFSNRRPELGDREEFQRLVEPVYHELNWFSFKDEDSSRACCSYQVNSYIDYGQKYGLSPTQYFDKIFELGLSGTKQIVFIKAKWVPDLCMNVVNQLGYGTGRLRIIGSNKITKAFMVPPGGEEDPIFIVPGILEKPWLCPYGGVHQQDNDPRASMSQNSGENSGEILQTAEYTTDETSSMGDLGESSNPFENAEEKCPELDS
ncbi:uncharacterized protein LOC142349054 [Convolutriloba macropyga]|uniref:uncharacterized protein LOC142349054 n=1 Tax=Convolutriloba macropyga TaxID=536237 RepID=UPI003F522AA0